MSVIRIIVGIAWGAISAQFFVQAVLSLIIAVIYLSATLFSEVRRSLNVIGTLVSLVQAFLFLGLFVGGNLLTAFVLDYGVWSATTITFLAVFVGSIVYCAIQAPGKILLAKMSAWRPYFVEAANALPPRERVAFAARARNEAKANYDASAK